LKDDHDVVRTSLDDTVPVARISVNLLSSESSCGIGGGKARDTFAFTVFFDPEKAPMKRSRGRRGHQVEGSVRISVTI